MVETTAPCISISCSSRNLWKKFKHILTHSGKTILKLKIIRNTSTESKKEKPKSKNEDRLIWLSKRNGRIWSRHFELGIRVKIFLTLHFKILRLNMSMLSLRIPAISSTFTQMRINSMPLASLNIHLATGNWWEMTLEIHSTSSSTGSCTPGRYKTYRKEANS